eukprot:gene38468-50509_t
MEHSVVGSSAPGFFLACFQVWETYKRKSEGSMQKPKPTPEQLQDAEERTTAQGLSTFAERYIEAAIIVDEKQGKRTWLKTSSSIPAYFLAAHGVELTFKAFLRHKGMSAAELRSPDVGHDLRQLFRRSKEYGLLDIFRMKASDMRALLWLVQMNDYQGLRYIRSGPKVFPDWKIVEPFAVRLPTSLTHPSMKIPTHRRQPVQQRREVFQVAGDQVFRFAFALPHPEHRQQP